VRSGVKETRGNKEERRDKKEESRDETGRKSEKWIPTSYNEMTRKRTRKRTRKMTPRPYYPITTPTRTHSRPLTHL
jgi:hypothetical protein